MRGGLWWGRAALRPPTPAQDLAFPSPLSRCQSRPVTHPTPSARRLIPQEVEASVSISCHPEPEPGRPRRGGGHGAKQAAGLAPRAPGSGPDHALRCVPSNLPPGSSSHPLGCAGNRRPFPSPAGPRAQPHSLVRGDPAQAGGGQVVAALLPHFLAGHLLQREPGLVHEAGAQLVCHPCRARQCRLQLPGPVLVHGGQGPREEALHLASVHSWLGEGRPQSPPCGGQLHVTRSDQTPLPGLSFL